ncbi:hypothetical protein L596_019051 [Steinernema carpocapsae]|uniref:Uncharacterized protein n=1 Tax=Steinernema carpocapsae TaxID=34508 RepID=A0A4U5N7J6_STECR|nr:hypothetical protein L596_019051 [Steinernema carpocapsae]
MPSRSPRESDATEEDTTAHYEQLEREVENMVNGGIREGPGDFTRWAEREEAIHSKLVDTLRVGFRTSRKSTVRVQAENLSRRRPWRAAKGAASSTSETLNACPREVLHSVEILQERKSGDGKNEEISARPAINPLKKSRPPVAAQRQQKPLSPLKEEAIHPLTDQLRALIQHLDIEQVALRKRQEEYFYKMQKELERERMRLKEDRRANEIAFKKREKELKERQQRVDNDESDKLKILKAKLKLEIDLKNEKSVEIYKLQEKIATLEGVVKAKSSKSLFRNRAENEEHEKEKIATRPFSSTTETATPCELPTLGDELDTGCRCWREKDEYGVTRRWMHEGGCLSVAWNNTQNDLLLELVSPEKVKLTFADNGTLYLVRPDSCGLMVQRNNEYIFGKYSVGRGGQIRKCSIDNNENIERYAKDPNGDSIGWGTHDVKFRHFDNGSCKVKISGQDDGYPFMEFVFLADERTIVLRHVNVHTGEKMHCWKHSFV